jgi:aminoglycoside phosphotransferase (APT) family kinase protein
MCVRPRLIAEWKSHHQATNPSEIHLAISFGTNAITVALTHRREMEALQNRIRKAMRQVDGSKIIHIDFSEAHVNRNCIVEMSSGRGYVIRVHLGWLGQRPPDSRIIQMYERERLVNNVMQNKLQLPAPLILLIDGSRRLFDTPYLIAERCPGTLAERLLVWLSPEEQRSILVEAGRALARIHSVVWAHPGTLSANGPTDEQNEYTSLDHLMDGLRQDLACLEMSELLSSSSASQLAVVFQRHRDALEEAYRIPRLVHADFNLRNILYDFEGESGAVHLSGVLDTEGACSGCYLQDFMSLELWSFLRRKWLTSVVSASKMRNWFFEGYGRTPDLLVYKLLYLRKRLSKELLDIGYLDDAFVLELDRLDLSEDLAWLQLP